MKVSKLRARMRRIRADHEAAAEEGGELNLVPYLDIVMNVILFMLATTTFVAALSDVSIASETASDERRAPALDLTVAISASGFTVASSRSVEPKIPLVDGAYDYGALAARMAEIKKLVPSERQVIVNADPRVPYQVLIGVLDACRGMDGERFPDARLSAGVN